MKKLLGGIAARLNENERLAKRVYIIITCLACVLSVILLAVTISSALGRKAPSAQEEGGRDEANEFTILEPDSSPTPREENETNPLTLEISDETATSLFRLATADLVKLDNAELSFKKPDILKIGADVYKESVDMLIDLEQYPLVKAGLLLAPESVRADMILKISYDEQTGRITANPSQMRLGGIDIAAFVPQAVIDSANDTLNSSIPADISIKSVEADDGCLRISF